jgi:pyruvate dehydrogenase E1 component beta subunit
MPTELAAPEAALRELSYAEAIREGLAQAMQADERVFLFGEDVGIYGGAFGVSGDLFHKFGPERVIDTPISELGIAGAAVGAAITGMKPVLELQFSDFVTLAMEQIVNQAAKIHFMFGGKATVPMVVRLPGGSGTGAAAQHSQSLEAWFAHVPGLKVVQPSTPHDAKGLLLSAIDDPNPVLIFEHKLLYKTRGPVPEDAYRVPIGKAAVAIGRELLQCRGRHRRDDRAAGGLQRLCLRIDGEGGGFGDRADAPRHPPSGRCRAGRRGRTGGCGHDRHRPTRARLSASGFPLTAGRTYTVGAGPDGMVPTDHVGASWRGCHEGQ